MVEGEQDSGGLRLSPSSTALPGGPGRSSNVWSISECELRWPAAEAASRTRTQSLQCYSHSIQSPQWQFLQLLRSPPVPQSGRFQCCWQTERLQSGNTKSSGEDSVIHQDTRGQTKDRRDMATKRRIRNSRSRPGT